MATVKPKTVIQQRLQASCLSHARTDVTSRGLALTIDEPADRGGTNAGLTPVETLWAALLGCTNVIGHRVAEANGVHFRSMKLRVEADFDRRYPRSFASRERGSRKCGRSADKAMSAAIFESTLTCPECGYRDRLRIAEDSCAYFHA